MGVKVKSKLVKLLKINLSLLIYALLVLIVVITFSYAKYLDKANETINLTIESIQTNIDKEDLENLNAYVSSIFSSLSDRNVAEDEINTKHTADFGHIKDYKEYASIKNALSLVYGTNESIYDLSLLYIDLDNNRMVYLADEGPYDLGVFRGLSYSYYSKIVLKKKASLSSLNKTWIVYRGANIYNDNNKVIATVNVSINMDLFKENVISICILCLIIYLCTCLVVSLVFLKLPAAYKKASVYLKANEIIVLSKKEKKRRAKEEKRLRKKEAKAREEKELEEEFKKDILEENKRNYETEETKESEELKEPVELKETQKSDAAKEILEDLDIDSNSKTETSSADMEPMSKPRETKEGEEEHPVIDWIVDQL